MSNEVIAFAVAALVAASAPAGASDRADARVETGAAKALAAVDPLIGTCGVGSNYGGMMPATCVPFGSFHLVPMTRLNRVGQLSYNEADDTLLGFILTRQPAIWMGDWGEVRVPIKPEKIESFAPTPYLGRMTAGGRRFEYTATMHAAWIRGDLNEIRLLNGYSSNRDDENLGYELPNFRGWRYVKRTPRDLQIGVSLISLEEARRNLEREIGAKSFETVVAETKAAWEDSFGRVTIEAPDDVRTIFYTSLYHTLLYPRVISENGRYYSAFDDKVHAGEMYSCYSLWDTYRAQHPWLTLIAPERVDGMMQSLLEMYREGGWLPKWPNPGYTGIMVGAPAEVVLAEAYVKGFRGFDLNLAYEAVRKNATVPQAGDATCNWADRGEFGRTPETRGGLSWYMKLGYVPCDKVRESVSRTQDFALADAAAAILAEATGHADDAASFRARSKSYTNLWNAAAGEFQPRDSQGKWGDPQNWRHFTEQDHQTAKWCIQHDPEGLAALMGGPAAAVRELEGLFAGRYWERDAAGGTLHGNEPSHHFAYLFNRFGAPERTRRHVLEILRRTYSTNRRGFDGNEDCGQMSAWYIFSALGFYPLDPASGEYELGCPLVDRAELTIGGRRLVVVKPKGAEADEIGAVRFNGRELRDNRIRHADLVQGGTLEFVANGH